MMASPIPPTSSTSSSTSTSTTPPTSQPPPASTSGSTPSNPPKVDTTISHSETYVQFRAAIPQNKISVAGLIWKFFDYGPKNVEPLICLHGTAGTADFFFYQIIALGGKGYRIISVQYPPYWTHHEWVMGFSGFLEQLGTEKVHILGQGLGAFLALHWTVIHPTRVSSLILCNGFWDTEPFHQSKNCLRMFHYLPEFALKKYILDSLPTTTAYPDTIDFVVEQVELLTRADVGARLTLNCLPSHIPGAAFDSYDQTKVTILDTTDEIVLPEAMRERLYDKFHNARYALLKHGGDFPFLSIPDEINLHIQIHLRTHGVFPTDADSLPSANSAPTDSSPHIESKSSDIPSLPKSNSTSNTSSLTTTTTSSPNKPTFFLPLSKKNMDDTKRKPRETSYHDEDEKALAQEEEDRERMRRLAQQDAQHTQTLPRTTQSVEDLDAIASARERIRKEKADKEEKRKRLEEAIAQEKLEREQQEKKKKEEEERQRMKQQSILSALVPDDNEKAARTSHPDDLF